MRQYRRILLKISGEALAGPLSFGLDPDRVTELAKEVADVGRTGVQIGLVLGGGNIFRGIAAAAHDMDRVQGDHMGMLATVINALAFQDALEREGIPTRVMTAIQMHQVAEPYIRRRAIRHLEKGRVVVLACGTLESTRLLLQSGIANSSGMVGKNFLEHLDVGGQAYFPELFFKEREAGDGIGGAHVIIPWFAAFRPEEKRDFVRGFQIEPSSRIRMRPDKNPKRIAGFGTAYAT